MLKTCPECDLQVSDKANICPHCGYPLKPSLQSSTHRRSHKRLPNGFGQITELKNRNLRKPFRAMVTAGKTSEGKPIQKLLQPVAYFETYNEAYKALMEYNKDPFDLSNNPTMQELYERWTDRHFEGKSASTIRNINLAWNYCSSVIGQVRIRDFKTKHVRAAIEDGSYKGKYPTAGMKLDMKKMLHMLLDYAVEYEYTDRNCARNMKLDDRIIKMAEDHKSHISFDEDEMKILWSSDKPFANIILFQCYSGFRPQEMCLLESDKVNINEWTIVGGMKTSNGINRTVPIHPCMRDFAKKLKELNNLRFIVDENGEPYSYDKYRYWFNKTIKDLGLNPNHSAHDCRKTFITMAKKYQLNEYAIKRIVGHSISDLTESTYTDRSVEWLHSEISKIKAVSE